VGNRSEQRISVNLPVKVQGADRDGNPFVETARIVGISRSGARLEGITCLPDPGGRVEVFYQNEKAWFLVSWVGQVGTVEAGQAGLRCLESGKFIWGVPFPEEKPDTYRPPRSKPRQAGAIPLRTGPSGWRGKERRRHPRHFIRGQAQITIDGSDVPLPGILTELSVGGCYIEMMSPLPVGTKVNLELSAANYIGRMGALVRTTQPGMGMGMAFTELSGEEERNLREILQRVAEEQGAATYAGFLESAAPQQGTAAYPSTEAVAPAVKEAPARKETVVYSDGEASDAFDALMRVLLRKGVITHAEVSDELQKVRTGKRRD
jgi:hypothetical protein